LVRSSKFLLSGLFLKIVQVYKYNGVIKHAKRQSNTKKSILYARNITRVKFGVQIHSICKIKFMKNKLFYVGTVKVSFIHIIFGISVE